ncbi:RNA polymerase sigma factor [Singulisphaera sp. PoT]|uniref:RNA polymerase sigma factor n=1 Tax=Singulisphaera sp. PoT TaxID=3411797 RepID=UPI003BF57B3A
MGRGPSQIATKSLTVLFESGTAVGLSDHELVGRFAARRDEQDPAAEAAFAALVARHSPMVFQVCRTVLGDRHEAEDAFQATFLVLASRAKSIRSRDSVGAWLYGVALRVSSRARTQATRRKHREQRHAARAEAQAGGTDMRPGLDGDIARILQEEIGRLPAKFRAAVVLCYLEGLTHEMAAGELGCPVGTIRSRLATARERLKRRLTRRGIASAAPLEWLASSSVRLAESASAGTAVPVALVEGAIRGAMQIGLGREALAGTVSAGTVTLMEGILSNMMTNKLMIMAVPVFVVGFVTAGVGLASNSAPRREQEPASDQAIGQEVPQKKDSSTPLPTGPQPKASSKTPSNGELKKAFRRRDEEDVKRLIREYQEKEDAFLKTMQEAKTTEAQAALQKDRVNPAFYAGALLQLAEQDPGTPAAEEALIWIATHLLYGSMVERAKEMIVRDHIKGDKLEPLFNIRQVQMVGSTATERLFREAMEKNQNRKIRGMACYHLACFLDTRAASIRVRRLFDPEKLRLLADPDRSPVAVRGS